jgi:hypothetical protein
MDFLLFYTTTLAEEVCLIRKSRTQERTITAYWVTAAGNEAQQ